MRNRKSLISLLLIICGFAFTTSEAAPEDVEFTPGEESGFYYTIKRGDTLWDLSQKFYNSQWDWPGLWEMNDDIKNPHWIYPGKKIRIYLRDKAKRKPVIVPVKKTAAPAKKVSPSFSFSEMDSIGFLKKDKQTSLGRIVKEEDGHLLMNKNDTIYIEPSGSGTLTPGETYHIFSAEFIEEKINKNYIFKGYKHLVKAKIKVIDHKGSYVTARITHGGRPVDIGDLVMEYYARDKVLAVEENPETINARIICSQDNNVMINDYLIAFIDVGSARVRPGQIYSVFRKNEIVDNSLWPRRKETIKFDNLESGKLIVLHTEDISSTVMILSSGYAIHPNDMVN